GIVAPRTLGVGYDNIEGMVAGKIVGMAVIWLCLFKFLSWSISLGSATSGGTLAPLFTIGGGWRRGARRTVRAEFSPLWDRSAHLRARRDGSDVRRRVARAPGVRGLWFETTLQPLGLLPLLGGCTAGYLVSPMRSEEHTSELQSR